MSMQRNLARQQKKMMSPPHQGGPANGGNPLASLLGGLNELEKLGGMAVELQRMMDGANSLVQELTVARESMEDAMGRLEEVHERLDATQFELECQRAVFLRFFTTEGSIFSSGETATAKFLAVEEQYRAEYAVLRFVMWCAGLAKERP